VEEEEQESQWRSFVAIVQTTTRDARAVGIFSNTTTGLGGRSKALKQTDYCRHGALSYICSLCSWRDRYSNVNTIGRLIIVAIFQNYFLRS
jgi:hypothetical protein